MDNYEIITQIGKGTYGCVFKATHKDSGKIVAIKKFRGTDNNDLLRRTALREIRIMKRLNHPNIVRYIDVFRHNGKFYLVMEFIEGSLLQLLEETKTGIKVEYARPLLFQLGSAVSYLHSKNIIHRDIKPENILVTNNNLIKLCDFGFARTLNMEGIYTDYVATRWYRSPELIVGSNSYGKPCDIWALGCLIFEMLTNDPLFAGKSDIDQINKIIELTGPFPPSLIECFNMNTQFAGAEFPLVTKSYQLRDILPDCDVLAIDLMNKILQTDPEKRITIDQYLCHDFFMSYKSEFMPKIQKLYDMEEEDLKELEITFLKRSSPTHKMFLSDNNNNSNGNGNGNSSNGNNSNNTKQDSKLEKCESEKLLHRQLRHTSSLTFLPQQIDNKDNNNNNNNNSNKDKDNIGNGGNGKDMQILKPKLVLSKCNLDSTSLIVSTAFPPINSSRRNRSSLIEEKVPPIPIKLKRKSIEFDSYNSAATNSRYPVIPHQKQTKSPDGFPDLLITNMHYK